MSYDLREKIDLIGYSTYQIVANNNLPTIRQVLAVLFYNLRKLSNSLDESSKLTIDECLIYWKKNHIPTQEAHKCVAKLKAEYERWRNIRKSASRRSDFQLKKETLYTESLDKLFDIARSDALNSVDESDRNFLLSQRGK